jgi:hypothetical protein
MENGNGSGRREKLTMSEEEREKQWTGREEGIDPMPIQVISTASTSGH